jgi:single-strand DNA-binding protein
MSSTTILMGNVTRDPDIRYTSDGQAVLTMGVAVNRRWLPKETKEWEESVSFFDVVCWRDLAENAALTLEKGSRVIVAGRLEQRTWQGEDGERHSKVELVAEDLGPSLRWATAKVDKTKRESAASDPEGDAHHAYNADSQGESQQASSGSTSEEALVHVSAQELPVAKASSRAGRQAAKS